MDDYVGVPEDMRCKRTDGKQWRCTALCMPDKTVCEKHYIQAKRRAQSSAARAVDRKARRKSVSEADVYMDSRSHDAESSRSASPINVGRSGDVTMTPVSKYREKMSNGQMLHSRDNMSGRGFMGNASLARPSKEFRRYGPKVEGNQFRTVYETPSKEMKNYNRNGLEEYTRKRAGTSGEADRLCCHQCGRNDRMNIEWCNSCSKRGYCHACLSRWYADVSLEDACRVCPACRGICTCRICLQVDNLVKAKVREITSVDKLRYLHSMLKYVLPMLKQIYSEEIFEIGVETKVHGLTADISRAKLQTDEQMCCDYCRVPILDYHRHCTNCSFDLCIACCRDLRWASKILPRVPLERLSYEKNKATQSGLEKQESDERSDSDESAIDFAQLFPKWKVFNDGSISCGPAEAGGCGSSKLILRRIFKINWVGKLLKCTDEMVNGCVSRNLDHSDRCRSCTRSAASYITDPNVLTVGQCTTRDHINDTLYLPDSQEIKQEGISHFHTHWAKGQPIIVKNIFECSLASSWEPSAVWREIQDTMNDKMDESFMVKAFDCRNNSEVDIELSRFIKGYSEEHKDEDGKWEILKIKDLPPPNSLEDFLLCRPELLMNFPLVEFVHSKWGILNLAAKMPHDALQNGGPSLLIAYGTQTDPDIGDSATNLQYNMGDQVYFLMHTPDASHDLKKYGLENGMAFPENSAVKKESGLSDVHKADSSQKPNAVAIWDVFRRQDVPKLNEYLNTYLSTINNQPNTLVKHPIYHQALYLNKDHKRKLKEQYGVEPWSFKQHIGEAVFVPAGCPFQIMNLQSSVQLVFDFLSPESLNESARMAQEIRCLPDDSRMKINMLEVSKMSLYAASSATREIQQIVLDPKFSSEVKFEDHNLTAMVAENLERSSKRQQLVCN